MLSKKINKNKTQKGKLKKKNIWKLHLKKFLKTQKGSFPSYSKTSCSFLFGYFGFKAVATGVLYKYHLDMLIRHLKLFFNKSYFKFWIRFHLYFPLTAKSIKSRMGKGKGDIKELIAKISKGRILFEFILRVKRFFLRKVWVSLNALVFKMPFKSQLFWIPISDLSSFSTTKLYFIL